MGSTKDACGLRGYFLRRHSTRLAKEALQTAEKLVRGLQEKKLREAAVVGQALQSVGDEHQPEIYEEVQGGQQYPLEPLSTMLDWPNGDDGGWMQVFLDAESLL